MKNQQKKKFYHSSDWLKKREDILRRDHYECRECRRRIEQASAEGVRLPPDERNIRAATLVHHIRHLEDAWESRFDDDNLEAVCAVCHNRLHGRTVEAWNVKRKRKPVTVERW